MKTIAISFLLAAALLPAQEIAFDSAPNFLKLPPRMHLGEVAGVATTSKGNVVVYTRTAGAVATIGGSRTFTHGGSQLFEFDPSGKFIREIGVGVYGFLYAQAVRVDSQDNIWVVDRGSSNVIKFAPDGRILMTMSRKPESVNIVPAAPAAGRGEAPAGGGRGGAGGRGGGRGAAAGAGAPGDSFSGPTDIAWDSTGNIFVSDGYGNSRVGKYDKNGKFIKSWGSRGAEPGQFDTPHSIAVDAAGNVYVADMGNKRIQVFDNNGTFKSQIASVGTPRTICISPGSRQFLFSSNSNDPMGFDNGEIYKLELDGKVLGKFGKAGTQMKEFGTVNAIDCRNPNQLYVGELLNWRVQKLTLR